MEFGLLGPLDVTNNGRSLRLGGSRQRALLALLLLRANEAVPLDQLVDGLWGDSPPKTAEQIVRVYVSQLLKLLEPERSAGDEPRVLLTRDAGYELRLRPDQLDTYRFEQLLQEGRNRLAADEATALGYLRGALALWRGPPLADFTYEPFAQAEIARLEDLRLNAVQERIEAEGDLTRPTVTPNHDLPHVRKPLDSFSFSRSQAQLGNGSAGSSASPKSPDRVLGPWALREAELRAVRSQAELGNERTREDAARAALACSRAAKSNRARLL